MSWVRAAVIWFCACSLVVLTQEVVHARRSKTRKEDGQNAPRRERARSSKNEPQSETSAAETAPEPPEEAPAAPPRHADSEIIEDPELAARGGAGGESEGDRIEDPELAGAQRSQSSADMASAAPSFASDARLVLHSRLGMDTRRGDPREETWEGTTIASLEASVRRSETLRFALGVRLRHHVSSLSHAVPDAAAERLELDAVPTAGYVDMKLAAGVHVQLGYQQVQLGRFDLVSASDVLSIVDVRDGPATLPEAFEVGQLAARVDYDPVGWLSLRGLYIPFFTPFVMSVAESDYGLAPQRQRDIDAELSMPGAARWLSQNLSRADRERFAQTGLAVFAPEPNLGSQQAALRATMHGTLGELSMTAATALEKLPALYLSNEAIAYLRDQTTPEVAEAFETAVRPIHIQYNRFALLSLDGAMDVPPLSIGFEAAYMFNRTLYTLGSGVYPGTLPLPDTSDIVQVGLRAEYIAGTELGVTAELFGAYTMRTPRDVTRGWMFFESGRYLAGVAAAAGWAPDFGLKLELGLLIMTGPSLVLAPRVGYRLLDVLELEVGAIVIEGPPPPLAVTPRIAVGTLYDTVDQVFAGFILSI